jgi:hypothetical protein
LKIALQLAVAASTVSKLLLVLLSFLALRLVHHPHAWGSKAPGQQLCYSTSSSRRQMPSANARWYKVGDALLVLSQGDITQWSGDAIVNAGMSSNLSVPTYMF